MPPTPFHKGGAKEKGFLLSPSQCSGLRLTALTKGVFFKGLYTNILNPMSINLLRVDHFR